MERNAKVKIPTFVTQFESGKEVTFYMVQIELGGIKWELKKRFNEFHDLNEALKRNHGNLPSLPGKTLLPVKKPEEIDKRRDGLEKFLQALTQKVDVYANQAFVRFLELDDHKPDLAINPLELTARITHMLMGYRDLYFSEDRKFYFSVTSDPSTVSRLDSYITNLNMPWDKKTEKDQVLLAVGNLEVWAKMKKGTDRFYYERLFLKTFKSQAICMDYNEKLGLIAIGLDNGFIAVFTFDRSDPTKIGELVNEKVHSARVMRIVLDERTGLMYSIGEDKFLKVMDIKSTTVISEVFVSTKKLTEMVVDKKNKIGYCADRGGSIIVVNLGSNPPRVGQVVKTSSEGAIRGLEGDFPNKRVYCSCLDDGYIHIFKLFDPIDPEGRIEKTASIKGAPGPRVIRYWPERQELFVGHKDGLVSVINPELNPTGPIYCKKEHDGNVNTIQIISGENLLITGSGDKNVKVPLSSSSSGILQPPGTKTKLLRRNHPRRSS